MTQRPDLSTVVSPAQIAPRPLIAGLKPITATSVKGFSLYWLGDLLLCAGIFSIASIIWINHYSNPEAAWVDVMYRQKTLALERRAGQGHRLVIIGGSGALFGIDAELIERKLHIPCVNFATHAGLKLRYQLYRAKPLLQSGDIVLLAPEYATWTYQSDNSSFAFDYFITYDKWFFARLPPGELGKEIWSIPLADWASSNQGWQDRRQNDYFHIREMTFYNYASVDLNGDLRAVVPDRAAQTASYPFPLDPQAASMQDVRSFSRYAKSKGIQLLFSWPNIVHPIPEPPPANAQPPRWLTDLLSECGFVTLNTPSQASFPRSWFMDSEYHVNPCGRRIRTEDLIHQLRPVLGLPAAPDKPSKVFLLAGNDTRLTDGNIFADDAAVRFRYLQPQPVDDPRGITPRQVAELIRSGISIYTDSPEARDLLASAGLGEQLESHGDLSITDWFARYPSHIICIAAAPGHTVDPSWKKVVPAVVYDQLTKSPPSTSIFGTGPYAAVHHEAISDVCANDMQDLPRLSGNPNMMPAIVALQAWSAAGGGPFARVFVDYGEFITSPTGICVLVIDPEMGIVVDRALFDGGPTVRTWSLFRVTSSGAL